LSDRGFKSSASLPLKPCRKRRTSSTVIARVCYRREVGGYHTVERGSTRGQQFNKVEMFQFTAPGQAEDALKELVARAQMLVEKLGLHYQTTLSATRGARARKRASPWPGHQPPAARHRRAASAARRLGSRARAAARLGRHRRPAPSALRRSSPIPRLAEPRDY
jgi:seryl-tRNA synthetase